MPDQVWMFVIGQVVTAASVYAAIRADLAAMRARVDIIERWKERIEGTP